LKLTLLFYGNVESQSYKIYIRLKINGFPRNETFTDYIEYFTSIITSFNFLRKFTSLEIFKNV